MSLLDQLNKIKLRPTTTILTQVDGSRFESRDGALTRLPTEKCGYVVDTSPDFVPIQVIDYLYIGSQDACTNSNELQKSNITHILSVGIEAPIKFDSIEYKFIECLDLPETNLQKVFDACFDWIDHSINARKSNVLVHCNAGVSRAPSIVIGYLMQRCHFGFQQAYDHLRSVRSCIRPNDGFLKQLKAT